MADSIESCSHVSCHLQHSGIDYLAYVIPALGSSDSYELGLTDGVSRLCRTESSLRELRKFCENVPEAKIPEKLREIYSSNRLILRDRESGGFTLFSSPANNAPFLILDDQSQDVRRQIVRILFSFAGRVNQLQTDLTLARSSAGEPAGAAGQQGIPMGPKKPKVDLTNRSVVNPGQRKRKKATGFDDDD